MLFFSKRRKHELDRKLRKIHGSGGKPNAHTVFINLVDSGRPRLNADPVDLDRASYLAIMHHNGRQCNIVDYFLFIARYDTLILFERERVILPSCFTLLCNQNRGAKIIFYNNRNDNDIQ